MSEPDVSVYMPVYIGDYLAATTDLTAEEHGVYLLLLMNMWRRGGTLPCDPPRLARMVGLSVKRWEAVWLVIGGFFTLEDGQISQRRLVQELEKSRGRRRRATDNGRAGGEAKARRGGDQSSSNPPSNSLANPLANPLANDLANPEVKSSSSTSTSTSEKIPLNPPGGGTDYPEDFEALWKAGTKRGVKFKAYKAWKRLKPKPALEAVIAGFRLWEESPQWRGGAVEHVSTFLNNRQWETDPREARASPNGKPQQQESLYPPLE